MKAFRRLAFVTTLATYFLIFVGGLVRVAGAGLGCPDWPRCFGRWIPPLSAADLPQNIDPATFNVTLAWIEWVNRLVGVGVGLLILATAIMAILRFGKYPRILVPTIAAAALVAVQGWLGAVVVASELQPLMVTLHLVLALIIVSLLVYVNQETYHLDRAGGIGNKIYPAHARLWVGILWVAAILQIVLGTEVRSAVEMISARYPLLSPGEQMAAIGLIDDVHMVTGMVLVLFTFFVGFSLIRIKQQPSVLVKEMLWLLMILAATQAVFGVLLMAAGLNPLLQLFHQWSASIYVGVALVLFMALKHRREQLVEKTRPFTRVALNAAAVVLIMAVGAYGVVQQADRSRSDIPFIKEIPEFSFTAMSGEPFGTEQMKGKLNIVDFFFTSCRGPCPVMAGKMQELYQYFEHSDQVQIVSVTVDPETDSLDVLRAYAKGLGVTDDRWKFIRGSAEGTSRLAEEGFLLSGDLPGMHSTKFILVDQDGWIRGYYSHDSDASLRLLKQHVVDLAGSS
jgi:cytochrome c oxidase assembly protein subunit 15